MINCELARLVQQKQEIVQRNVNAANYSKRIQKGKFKGKLNKIIASILLVATTTILLSNISYAVNPNCYETEGKIKGNTVELQNGNIWEDNSCLEFKDGTEVKVTFDTVGTVGIYDDVIVNIKAK